MAERKLCSHCGSDNCTLSGFHNGTQRYFCKNCKRRFSDIPPKYSLETKMKAVKAYLRGAGVRGTADIFKVAPATILNWIKAFREQVQKLINDGKNRLKSDTESDIIELDEIYTYLKKNQTESQFGLLILEGKNVLLLL